MGENKTWNFIKKLEHFSSAWFIRCGRIFMTRERTFNNLLLIFGLNCNKLIHNLRILCIKRYPPPDLLKRPTVEELWGFWGARPPLIAIRVAKMYSKTFLDAIAMVWRRVYATLILIGQSNLDRPIRADGTKHRDTMKTKHRDWIEKCSRRVFLRLAVAGRAVRVRVAFTRSRSSSTWQGIEGETRY